MIKNLYERIRRFLRDAMIELRKVAWPTRQETISSTGIVLLTIVIMGAYIGVVDMLLSGLLSFLLKMK